MRIITGTARGRKLEAPAGLATRPTSEKVKEAVFSALQFEIEGARVLDLFAGSGQMGLEALSRGASRCVIVDSSKAAQAAIRANIEAAGFGPEAKLVAGDAGAYLRSTADRFDIAFCDPPYRQENLSALLAGIGAVMAPAGILALETDAAEDVPSQAAHLQKHREYRYGKTKVTVFRTAADE